jgi:hypothetical protein
MPQSRHSRRPLLFAVSWFVLIAAIGIAAGTAYFLALGIVIGPAHGPFIEVVVLGAIVAAALLLGAFRLRRYAAR